MEHGEHEDGDVEIGAGRRRRRRIGAGAGGRLGFSPEADAAYIPPARKDDFAQSGSVGITATATAQRFAPDLPATRSMTEIGRAHV